MAIKVWKNKSVLLFAQRLMSSEHTYGSFVLERPKQKALFAPLKAGDRGQMGQACLFHARSLHGSGTVNISAQMSFELLTERGQRRYWNL